MFIPVGQRKMREKPNPSSACDFTFFWGGLVFLPFRCITAISFLSLGTFELEIEAIPFYCEPSFHHGDGGLSLPAYRSLSPANHLDSAIIRGCPLYNYYSPPRPLPRSSVSSLSPAVNSVRSPVRTNAQREHAAIYKRPQNRVGNRPTAMIIAGQDLSPWTVYCSLSVLGTVGLCLFLAIHYYIIRHGQHPYTPEQSDSWTQSSIMEKAKSNNETPPPATACDVLNPLSSNGAFPSSGAVAARAREQMAAAGNSSNSSSPTTQVSSPSQAGSDTAQAVQKRSETVQELREEDADGVRTWRRLIVEYN